MAPLCRERRLMVDETRSGMLPTDDVGDQGRPSRAASIGTMICVGAIVVGIIGQIVLADAAAFTMIAALGFATLATLVFTHQQ